MGRIFLLKNTIQYYSWGSHTFIARFMGENVPSVRPEAELWMGAHPSAPSRVLINGKEVSLAELIKDQPFEILGEKIAHDFSCRLPFLFKVLAAAEPLSLQAHPNREQAQKGFSRENSRGIAMDAPNRSYRDQNPKPELICALTPLHVLKGFRAMDRILDIMSVVLDPFSHVQLEDLRSSPDSRGLKRFFHSLVTTDRSIQGEITRNVMEKAENLLSDDPFFPWLERIYGKYPNDIGLVLTLMLNFIRLEPGEALYVPPGEIHAYIEGAGIELMADSDNVLRGGLTEKYVDWEELLNILDFNPTKIHVIEPEKAEDGSYVYPSRAEEFRLSRLTVGSKDSYRSPKARGIEIMICTDGSGRILDEESGEALEISGGMSVMIPAQLGQYLLDGEMTIYKASVPLRIG